MWFEGIFFVAQDCVCDCQHFSGQGNDDQLAGFALLAPPFGEPLSDAAEPDRADCSHVERALHMSSALTDLVVAAPFTAFMCPWCQPAKRGIGAPVQLAEFGHMCKESGGCDTPDTWPILGRLFSRGACAVRSGWASRYTDI